MTTDNMGTQYSYDAEGRIATAGSWTYGYDGDGNRVLRSDGGSGGATYWYNAGGTLSDEQSVELAPGHPWAARLHCYFYFNGGVALQIGFSPCCWPSYYLIQDLLGSTRGSVGANSAVVDSDYYPFGEYVTQPSDTTLEQRFTGKERDAESGNDYFGARYYASSMGRFLSPDWSESPVPIPSASLSDPQSLNLYSYTRNNPLTRKDDDGHCDDDGGKHGSVWCFFHAIGFVESDTERSARIENERNALLGGTHPDGTPLTPAERKALHGAPQDQIDKLYGDVIYQQGLRKLDSQSRQAWMFPWTVAEINSNWHEGSFDSSEESLNYHFDTHGEEVGAESESEYLRKAEAFKSNLKGAQKSPVEGATEGVTRYTKNGKYIDLASDGRIVSFGKQ
ncbi:MAG TPA: RHS repeat-associated core domain-containing protein [Terracidiphilus sp.]|nr:RHS repeat-associated core domain-containing protein [Terracidiphilus sp.]